MIHPGLSDFLLEFPLPKGDELSFVLGKEDHLDKKGNKITVSFTKECRLYRSLLWLKAHPAGDYSHLFLDAIPELTFLLDCSRNAVMTVDSLKKLIRFLAGMGYDSLMLYTEDTYEIKEEPFFGYMRGRYREEELRQIDAYASQFGIELIPCIQTLAHLNGLKQWARFENLFDIDDIFLADDEKTYAFIETMVKAVARTFHSRRLNIGMDEAHLVGRGKHQDIHGPEEGSAIMMRHLNRVLAILKKYGFEASMWSDMYGGALNPDGSVDPKKAAAAPKDVTLIYWDYYSQSQEHYAEAFRRLKGYPNPLSFATACWKWSGYTPQNQLSFLAQRPAFKAAIASHLSNVIVTAWGDNGGETSPFAVLPAMLCAALSRQGIEEIDPALFKALSGSGLADFLKLDSANLLFPDSLKANTQNKIFLLMDPFLSPFDSLVPSSAKKTYAAYAKTLTATLPKTKGFRYLFRTQEALNALLSVKAPLGLRLREHYQKGNREGLKADLRDLKTAKRLLARFQVCYEKQWFLENKPEGYEVQSLRLGGAQERLSYAARTLQAYLSGKQEKIDELELTLLDYYGKPTYTKPDDNCEYRWRRLSSVGVNE